MPPRPPLQPHPPMYRPGEIARFAVTYVLILLIVLVGLASSLQDLVVDPGDVTTWSQVAVMVAVLGLCLVAGVEGCRAVASAWRAWRSGW